GDGISDLREHNWYGAGLSHDRLYRRRGHGKDDLGLQVDQLLSKPLYLANLAASPTNVDPNVAAIGPTDCLHLVHKRLEPDLSFRIAIGIRRQHGDPRHSAVLLRARRERPRGRSSYCLMKSRRRIAFPKA